MNDAEKNAAAQIQQAQGLQDYEYGTPEYAERTKPWAECGIEQKLERLRNEIMEARHAVRWNNDRHARNENKLHLLEQHQHGADGAVMVRTRDIERGYGEAVGQIKGSFDPLA